MPKFLCIQRSQIGQTPAECAQSAPKEESANAKSSPAQMQEMFAKFTAWREKYQENIVDMGGKLAEGKLVTDKGILDGPFVELKELIGGYMILSADSLDEAVEISSAIPGLVSADSGVWVREIQAP